MKLFLMTWNWSLSAITFSISLLIVLRRMTGWKDLVWSYVSLFGLGIITVEECLKWLGQCPKSMYASAMLMMWDRHTSCLRIVLRCHYVSLSGLGAEELLHFINVHLNFSFKNRTQVVVVLDPISLRTSASTWWWRAVLNVAWRAPHKLSRIRHSWPSYLMFLMAGSFRLLIQFINSHGPRLLFVTSWIFMSKKDLLVFLMTFLNFL